MRLVTFRHDGRSRPGRLEGDVVVDLSERDLPNDMLALLEAGPEALVRARSLAGSRIPVGEVRLEAPLRRPPKILAAGLNYADHVAETGRERPKLPIIFNKQSTAVVGPFDAVHRPRVSSYLDYEGELGFVIGQRCRHVPEATALDVVAGYTIVNDVSVRDWQRRSPTMTMGKSFDTHCPFGPAIVTPDEFGDPAGHRIRTLVNGEVRQDSDTKELIFGCAALIAHLSTAFTLEPGDLIATGTPSGVAAAMDPPRWLVPGDVVRVEIEGLGAIESPIVEEPTPG